MVTTAIVLFQQHPRPQFQPAGSPPASYQSSRFISDLLWGSICLRRKCFLTMDFSLLQSFNMWTAPTNCTDCDECDEEDDGVWIINLEDRSGLHHPLQPPALLPSHVFEESVHEYWNSPTNEARNILSLFAVEISTYLLLLLLCCCCYGLDKVIPEGLAFMDSINISARSNSKQNNKEYKKYI